MMKIYYAVRVKIIIYGKDAFYFDIWSFKFV